MTWATLVAGWGKIRLCDPCRNRWQAGVAFQPFQKALCRHPKYFDGCLIFFVAYDLYAGFVRREPPHLRLSAALTPKDGSLVCNLLCFYITFDSLVCFHLRYGCFSLLFRFRPGEAASRLSQALQLQPLAPNSTRPLHHLHFSSAVWPFLATQRLI